MRKELITGLMIAVAGAVGWHYASPQTRETLLGFVGMASRRDTQELRHTIRDAVLPEDPIARRAALAKNIQRSIRELQRREITAERGAETAIAGGFAEDEELSGKTTAEVLAGARNAVAELEGANKDTSVGTKITERILERILPAAQCKE